VLELVRRERLRVAQDTAFGDIALLPIVTADAA
jgi:chromatin segregation and condensation protein Rec8/ScpA/Scc1 (kleisin family)